MKKSLQQVRLDDVLEGRPFVDSDTRVSAKSRFGDDLWDFTDLTKVRLSSVIQAKLRIDWGLYCSARSDEAFDDHRGALLPRQMLDELKVFAYLYLKLPGAFGSRGVQSVKPQTVVVTVRALVRLFSDVLQCYQLAGLTQQRNEGIIRSVSDISLHDIRTALAESSLANGDKLKKGLELLGSPIMLRAYSKGPLQWNAHDVAVLDFKFTKKRTDYKRVMPNELFRFISNEACADVLGFLHFIGQEPYDKAVTPAMPSFSKTVFNGAQMLADYVAIRQDDREYAARNGKKRTGPCAQAVAFKRAYGIGRREMFEWLYRVQRAAFTVVGIYTGARYSDLTTFTNQCIKTVHGIHVLAGTLVKNKDVDAEEGVDLWPAIPIMRDAVTCLQFIEKATFNPFLLSGSKTIPVGETPRSLSLNGLTNAITNYLHKVDISDRWADWHVNAHLLRHTLAHQLARADVGLVFIAHQMKHLHTALNALPPDVTMMYGNVGDLATQRALHSESAYLEAAKELYSPNRPVAGGGAEAFMTRRKAYFEGMAAQGWTADEILENLAKQGLPFASVGIGYCGGRRDTLLKDGTKEQPPCIGSLQCNPGACNQALITRTHESAWRKILVQNRTLAVDPRMAHAKEPLLAAIKAAEKVLTDLNPEVGVTMS